MKARAYLNLTILKAWYGLCYPSMFIDTISNTSSKNMWQVYVTMWGKMENHNLCYNYFLSVNKIIFIELVFSNIIWAISDNTDNREPTTDKTGGYG